MTKSYLYFQIVNLLSLNLLLDFSIFGPDIDFYLIVELGQVQTLQWIFVQ